MTLIAQALRDGAFIAAAASAVVMGSLRANPRLFMRHFPDALRQRLPPLEPSELRVGRWVGAGLMALLVGGPILSTLLLVAGGGAQPLWVLARHAFIVGMVFNAVDWLILDELWIGLFKPAWAIPPGATIGDFKPFDHGRHARGFLAGTGLSAIVAALAAVIGFAAGFLAG